MPLPNRNSPGELPPELTALEARLGALAPAASNVDRDQLMYLAGSASRLRPPTTRAQWIGLGTIAACMLLSNAVIFWQFQHLPVERVVYVDRPVAISSTAQPTAGPEFDELTELIDPQTWRAGNFALRERMLREGPDIDDEPTKNSAAPGPLQTPNRLLLNQLLEG